MPVYTLPDLPYGYSALAPVISPEIIELHHDKHHAAYVKGANDTLEQLAEARDKESWGAVNGLEKNLWPSISPATSCTASTGRT
jgi:Fe-Mn family superoxide dismutase